MSRLLVAVSAGAVLFLLPGCGGSDTSPPTAQPRPRPDFPVVLPDDLESLVDSLYGANAADRAHAASQLGELANAASPTAPYLIDALSDPDWRVRWRAAEALGAVGGTEATEPLIAVLSDRDGDWSVRTASARSLGQLGDARAVKPLIDALNDMNAHVRHMAVIALGKIGTPETVEPLTAAARSDHDAAVRFSAAEALQKMRVRAATSQ